MVSNVKFIKKQENAVSPIIATIIILAIAVVLAALLGGIIFGMLDNGNNMKSIGVTVEPFTNDHATNRPTNSATAWGSTHGVTVTIHRGAHLEEIEYFIVLINGEGTYNGRYYTQDASYGVFKPPIAPTAFANEFSGGRVVAGYPYKFRPHRDITEEIPNAQVVVKAYFKDGTEQVLYQGIMTIPATPPERT